VLAELQISDFAIIECLNLRLGERFNAFTGETGAGKSIIIDALGVVLGGRASPEMVRTGASAARVQALFQLDPSHLERLSPALERHGAEPTEDLVLTREISAAGRSTARVNGALLPVAGLREVAEGLVDITGQSEHLSLLRPAAQLDMLDQYAEAGELRSRVAELYSRARELEAEISGLVRDRREAERRADMLRYQLEEIEAAAPQPGEDEELLARRTLLANAERLSSLAETAYQALYGGSPSAVDGAREAETALDELVGLDPQLGGDLETLREAAINLEECALTVRRYRDSVEYDPGQLAQLEDRLDALNRLKRKYGTTVGEVLEYGRAAAEELDGLEHGEERAQRLGEELEGALARLSECALELSALRTRAASELGGRIEGALADLLMARARVETRVTRKPVEGGLSLQVDGEAVGVDSTGIDRVELMLSPNPGEPLKPMARIASGGETARILLAVRSVLSEADRTPTLVFDEVDVGVGGRSGHVVGEKLYGLTRGHQVFAITHLAQVAAYADAHYRITKLVADDRTSTRVDELDAEAAREELAAMLGGLPVTEKSLQSADELLARARQWKLGGARSNGKAPATRRRATA
jgi:DNA repair protein RecN (Recombination protein N)